MALSATQNRTPCGLRLSNDLSEGKPSTLRINTQALATRLALTERPIVPGSDAVGRTPEKVV